jgi:hypothetical protein
MEVAAPLDIEFTPHEAQRAVVSSPARFRVVACGRRWGKTLLSSILVLEHALTTPGSLSWWVAPVYSQTDIAFRMFLRNLPPQLITVNRAHKTIDLKSTGSRVVFKSGDNPDTLRGEGVSFLCVDEAAFIKEDVWYASLRPTLSDTDGQALLIGTFAGENWFYEEYERGQDPLEEEYASWRFPTSTNPYIPAKEIEIARRTLPRETFEQEYESSPLSYKGAVFNGLYLQEAIDRGQVVSPRYSELPTYAGLDWGYTAPTALEVCQEDPEGRISWIDEQLWTATELNERCEHIVQLAATWRIRRIYADAAGATENATLGAYLARAGLDCTVKPVSFSKFKERGIQVRRFHLERGLESISPRCKQLAHNSKRYRYKEDSEDVEKKDDHTCDAATAFYASRPVRRG